MSLPLTALFLCGLAWLGSGQLLTASTADWYVSGASDTTWTAGNFAQFSGTAGTVTLNGPLSAGAVGYVAKPFHPVEVAARIQQLLGGGGSE